MIVAFPEPRAPKERVAQFFCPLGSLNTVYTVVIFKKSIYLRDFWARAWTNTFVVKVSLKFSK